MIRSAIFVLFLITCSTGLLHAQKWEAGVTVGGAGYLGDLNQRNPVKLSGAHGGVHAKYNIDSYFGAAVQFNFAQIRAMDSESSNLQFQERNLSFRTDMYEVNAVMEFNFLEYLDGVGRKKFSPFMYAGVGYLFYKPTAELSGVKYYLPSYRTEGQEEAYNARSIVIPYGFGARYSVSESLSLFSKVGFRETFTDYLDDVSGLYPNAALLTPIRRALSDRSVEVTGSNLGQPGTQRGDLRKRDSYMFVGIGISYTFVSAKCY